jgi:fatty acid synthase subunit alpha, fungi type
VGYIKHFDGRHKYGTLHVGWVDAKTGEPVDDKDIRGRYEKEIMNHAGVRFIGEPIYMPALAFLTWTATSTPEPGLFRGYDPKHKIFNSEVELIHDLEPLEVTDSFLPTSHHDVPRDCSRSTQ